VTGAGLLPDRNVVPGEYRGVAVTEVDVPLDDATLTAYFTGREAYRRTRFIVVRNGPATAVLAVQKRSQEPLFSAITGVRTLVGPAECVFVRCPDVDTAVPSALARAALAHAPAARGVVVEGRYGHVSFILDPAPVRVRVREVVPPWPPKLLDQTQRLLDVTEDLPPIELVPELLELGHLARGRPSGTYLLPCRGGGVQIDGAGTAYLDERPERRPWVLVGCERSQQIHEWFYGERAPQVDICPREGATTPGPLLTRCCLLERHIDVDDGRVVVPWGASTAQITEALRAIVQAWEPTWAPA
jgi:hypothetical protein